MKIDASGLTGCSVEIGGDHISLGLLDGDGRPVQLKLSAADACSLAMTLPRLLQASIREKHRDDSLRYAYPLDGWTIETASDETQLILTLVTGDGFEVSFTTRPDMCSALRSALGNYLSKKIEYARPALN